MTSTTSREALGTLADETSVLDVERREEEPHGVEGGGAQGILPIFPDMRRLVPKEVGLSKEGARSCFRRCQRRGGGVMSVLGHWVGTE